MRAALEAGGALFFDDLLARLRLLPSQLEAALSEAVGLLREVRRCTKSLELVSLSAADPLNLAGIVTPGAAVPRGSGRVHYLEGVLIASQSGRESTSARTSTGAPPGKPARRSCGEASGPAGWWWPQTG